MSSNDLVIASVCCGVHFLECLAVAWYSALSLDNRSAIQNVNMESKVYRNLQQRQTLTSWNILMHSFTYVLSGDTGMCCGTCFTEIWIVHHVTLTNILEQAQRMITHVVFDGVECLQFDKQFQKAIVLLCR